MSARIRCPDCNLEWPASTTKCYKCGVPLGAGAGTGGGYSYADTDDDETIAAQVLRSGGRVYREGGAYRDGNKLVMVEGAAMPRRCPVCNSEDVYEPTELTISRETKEMGGVSGLIKAGIDTVSGWNYTGPVEVTVYFCERHQNRLRNRLILWSIVAVASLLYLLVAYLRYDATRSEYYDIFAAVIGAGIGVVMLAICGKNPASVWFKPRRFVDRTVWVSGAGRTFLESLPDYK